MQTELNAGPGKARWFYSDGLELPQQHRQDPGDAQPLERRVGRRAAHSERRLLGTHARKAHALERTHNRLARPRELQNGPVPQILLKAQSPRELFGASRCHGVKRVRGRFQSFGTGSR